MATSRGVFSKSQVYPRRQGGRGLREVRLWVADTRTPEFAATAEREARVLRGRKDERDALAFLEAAFDWPEG